MHLFSTNTVIAEQIFVYRIKSRQTKKTMSMSCPATLCLFSKNTSNQLNQPTKEQWTRWDRDTEASLFTKAVWKHKQ